MITLRAIAAIQRPELSGVSDLVGYDDDGMPIMRARTETVEPGALFEVDEADVARLLRLGAATDDLSTED
ncbi:hypothetical protein [Brevundimonas sp. SL161]|uniref:hypothetical protein n=1 Tax=Brevundimonas sp. SL161 TaxID=2804613 RepID=UPI003CE9F05D